MRLHRVLLSGWLVIGAAWTARAADAPPATQPSLKISPLPASLPADKIELHKAITFATRDGKPLNLDLARPKVGKGPRPAVMCLFGGGWISGSRTGMTPWIRYLAGYGYVAVAPTYRLAPADPYPACLADVRECVRWMRRNAAKYDIDPDRIGAMGLSAGGHLALIVGLTNDENRFGEDDAAPDKTSMRVQAVVNYFGPADLAAKDWSKLAVRRFLVPFLGGTADEKPEEYAKVSPIHYVTKDDPPVLTFHGNKDSTVPISQSIALHKKLEEAGVESQLVIERDQNHGWRDPLLTETREEMVRFFDKNLKKKR